MSRAVAIRRSLNRLDMLTPRRYGAADPEISNLSNLSASRRSHMSICLMPSVVRTRIPVSSTMIDTSCKISLRVSKRLRITPPWAVVM